MANPAELLHRLLVSWSGADTSSTERVRQDASLNEHVRAVGYLSSIGEALAILKDQGKKVNVWRKNFPTWKRMVFNYPRNWQGANRSAIDQVALDHLETLIDRVDEIAPSIEVDKISILLLYLSAVEIALKEDESLPEAIRMQVSIAVRQIRDYVDNLDQVDSFDFQKAISNLFAALAHAVLVSRQRERWNGWFENFVWAGFGDAYGRIVDAIPELDASYGAVLSLVSGG